MRNKKSQFKLLVLIFTLVLSLGIVLAILAFPSGTTDLRAQTCNTESASATSGSFSGSCTGTYPAACPTDRISCNEGTTETATTSGNNQYMGFKISNYNNTLTNCGSITNVRLCYEWWSSSANIGTCTVKVSANGGATNTTVSSACPGTGTNPGEICTDVTASASWVCGNFFTGSGTRAIASMEVISTTGGSKTLTADSFYFNVTYTADTSAPVITINYPGNATYSSNVTSLNSTISDINLQACWWSNNSGATNNTFTCGTNLTGLNASSGSHTWRVYANDSFGNANSTSVTFSVNLPPVISNVTALPNPVGGSMEITIYANTTSHGVNDTEGNALQFFCSDNSAPTASNTNCTGGTTTDSAYPYILTCSFTSQSTTGDYTKYCRVYDGLSYSSAVQANYTVNATVLATSIVSVAGDTIASYYDTIDNSLTEIIVSGESGMSCRWSSSDLSYSGMSGSNACSISGATGNCSVNDVSSQGFTTRYVSCQNSLGVGQNASQNLDVQFYLDYTPPNTTDNSVSIVKVPNYTITITEGDNVDSDPTSYYCTSASAGCNPTILIDNGGIITYTSSNRGVNYLRYYSVDDAGNSQVIVNKTININQLLVFTSASDNAVTIRGGTTVTISTNSQDSDSGQNIRLYVCSSSGANSSGCSGTQYCTALSTANVSCGFASETDSALHTWYAYIFDELNEAATSNFSGGYTTDSQAPVITVSSPGNGSVITQNSVTLTMNVDEALSWAAYSLNGQTNVSMSNISSTTWTNANTSIANGQYNVTFYANDSYNNLATYSGWSFTIDTTAGDTTAPEITIRSPLNNSYYTSASVLLNITTDEALSWAGFTNNSGVLTTLGNVSAINWNATITLAEGQHNVTFYANDSSSNKNSANKSITFYVDLNNPQVSSFSCTNPVNDSGDVRCSVNATDSVGLSYYKIGWNFTGSWQNSSQQTISGSSSNTTFIISGGNTTTPGSYSVNLYLYDLSGRINDTSTLNINVTDITPPTIWNVTYWPNTTAELDPGIRVNVNATVNEDYNISSVILMYQNISAGIWTSVVMGNLSAITINGISNTIYNSSFVPGNGTWIFRINATDSAGNSNISANYTLVVENDTSFWNSTTIPATKSFTYAQRSNNNTLGVIYLNNTGDNVLNFSLNITSAISNRFNINYTGDDNATYQTSPAGNLSLNILVNTTSLVSGLYYYNISVSSGAGTTVYERQLNIQTAEGAYLVVSIDSYSSSVTKGQTGIELVASVINSGTRDATGVYLNWTLPGEFTITSGSGSRNLGNLPIGSSGTNTITISVSSSSADSYVNISAIAASSNADSSNATKQVQIGSPVTVTETVTTPGAGGGGAVGAGAEAIVYSRTIEIVRGKEDSFDIDVTNKYLNSSLEDLTLNITGFLAKYISISPSKISRIESRQKDKFIVTLKIPSYKESHEEHTLKAIVSGYKVDGSVKTKYTETQNIKLIIQEVSHEDTSGILEEAKRAIEKMRAAGFNVVELEKLLKTATEKLGELRNKEAKDLADNIVQIEKDSFYTDSLMRNILVVMDNPKKVSLLTGSALRNFDEIPENISIKELLVRRRSQETAIEGNISGENKNYVTGMVSFSPTQSSEIENLLLLASAAFERGDYSTAKERAESARDLLLTLYRGSFVLFIYLYWHFILIGIMVFSILGIVGYRKFEKVSVAGKIIDLDREETNLSDILMQSQHSYFAGKISVSQYNSAVNQNQQRLSKLKEERTKLRNRSINLIKPENILSNLEKERQETEREIIKLQENFYKKKIISETGYKTAFKMLNERLAEIEEERATLILQKESGKENSDKIAKEPDRKKFFSRIKDYFARRKKNRTGKGIVMIDNKLMGILKNKTHNEDYKNKWINLKK